jgi:cysteine desulfurase
MHYLDNNATTKVLPEVLEAMLPYLQDQYGNPSSKYQLGRIARNAIEEAREYIAVLLGSDPSQIVFNSCATEGNNSAIHSALMLNPEKKHIVSSPIEHSSVLQALRQLEAKEYEVTYLGVDENGNIDLSGLESSITEQTALVTLMWANNETGVISPVEKVSAICQGKGVPYHCDVVQAAGKLDIALSSLPIDFATISGHKFHAPKGTAALYVRDPSKYSPILTGGGQENGMRAGTESVPLIAGLGRAAKLAKLSPIKYQQSVKSIRDEFEQILLNEIPGSYINSQTENRLPNTSNFGIAGIGSTEVVNLLDSKGIMISSGSACMGTALSPSHVISAIKGHEKANEAIRISLDVETKLVAVKTVVAELSSAMSFLT